MIKDKRRRKRRIRRFFKGLLIFLVLLGIAALIIIKVFTVDKVVVTDNELYSDEQIEKWVLNDEYSWNSLYVYLKYRFMDTEEVPFIDTMEVSLKPPHTITIKVYEKGMLGYLYIDSLGQNIYFDKDGFVIEMSSETIDDVPKISGITCSEVVLYEKLKLEQKGVLKELLAVTQMLKKFDISVDGITYNTDKTFTLNTGNITIQLGDTDNLEDKITRLDVIYPQIEGLTGTLRLDEWSEDNTDITFEKTE